MFLFSRRLNINKKEAGFVFLLFISAGFLGIFLSTFDIATHAMFLDKLNQKNLAMVYLVSGLLGFVLFFIYRNVFLRIPVKLFYFINLTLILLVVISYFLYNFSSPSKLSVFAGLTIMFPINLFALINFWRYIRRLVQPLQYRHASPIIELGFIGGILVGSYGTIGLLLYFEDYYNTMIPMVITASLLFHYLLQFPLNYIHNQVPTFNHRRDVYVPIKGTPLMIFSNRYTIYLFFFVLLSSVIGFLIHYTFMSLSWTSFPHIIGLSKFYGLFTGTLFLFMFGIDKFLARKILYSYDSPYSLILFPVAMVIIIAVTLIIHVTLGNAQALARFTFLFILLGMNKIVYETAKYSIQVPSLRTLFKTLDIRFIQTIFPRIEGSLVMLGMFVAGCIITTFLNLKFYSLIIILLSTLLLTFICIFFAFKLIKSYKSALIDSIKKMRIDRSVVFSVETYNEKIRKILVGNDSVRVINALKLSAQLGPITYQRSLQRMLANPEPAIQEYVLQCIENESLVEFLSDIKEIKPSTPNAKALKDKILQEFEKKIHQHATKRDIEPLTTSRSVNDRIFAAELIGVRKDLKFTPSLVNLSREFEPEVKLAAVKAITKICSPEHSYLLIEFLSSPQFHAYAFEALIEIGEPAVEYLERLFLNPGTDDHILARVVRIYGKIGTSKTVDLLLNKLDNQSRRITFHAIEALRESNFQATNLNINKILNVIVRTISTMGWNMLVYTTLPKDRKYNNLKIAFKREIDKNYHLLFELLALAYNPRTINQIRELIEKGSQVDISHAIELLDHFVYEDIKVILFPVVENIPDDEKVRRLQYYFPIEGMNNEELISSTLTRDFNLLSFYPRICAMQLTLETPDITVTNELIANLFHPNPLLREIAATVIFRKDPELFSNVIERLESTVQLELSQAINAIGKPNSMIMMDKFMLLNNTHLVLNLDEEILIEIARYLTVNNFSAGSTLDLAANKDQFALFIVASGKIGSNNIPIDTNFNNMKELFYSEILVNFGISSLQFQTETIIVSIDKQAVENLLFDYSEMANCVLSCVEHFKIAV
jgi:ATP:ADP antiporter, AAA family